jgi:hypothetical protein
VVDEVVEEWKKVRACYARGHDNDTAKASAMAYLELFERAADHVRNQGVTVTFKCGKPLPQSVIERAQAGTLIAIPASMAEFYAEVGDGLFFRWTPDDDEAPFAAFEFPKLRDRIVESIDKVRWRTEWDDTYDFRGTKDRKLAKQTALRMRKWMPFHDEGSGDRFCLDTAIDSAPVVFDQHDWFDGGTGENGHVLAGSLFKFLTDWSQVCFQFPRSLWWPLVFRKPIGINWNSDEFRQPFRLHHAYPT